jgi:hypothetical protein
MGKESNNAAAYVLIPLVGVICGVGGWALDAWRRGRGSATWSPLGAQASALNERVAALVARSNELVESNQETDMVYREVMEAAADPNAPLTLTKSVREAVESSEEEPSAEEVVKAGQELLNQLRAERSATQEPEIKISVVLPWRFNRPVGVPRPEVVDAQRLAKLPERDIRLALHRAYADDTLAAKKLHARLRGRAERAVFPLREDAVGALEDIYVVHPDRVMHD